MRARTVILAVDSEETGQEAGSSPGARGIDIVSWAVNHALRDGDDLRLVTALDGPVVDTPFSTLGDASIWAVTVWERERKQEEEEAMNGLKRVAERLKKTRWQGTISEHVLDDPPASPSTKGSAITEYAGASGADIVIMPNTPPPSNVLRRKLALFHGNGSPSEYCALELRCPVMLVAQGGGSTACDRQPAVLVETVGGSSFLVGTPEVILKPRRVCLAVHSQEELKRLLAWGGLHFINQNWDELHVVRVCLRQETPARASANDGPLQEAMDIVCRAGVLPSFIRLAAVSADGSKLCSYLAEHDIHTVMLTSKETARANDPSVKASQQLIKRCARHASCSILVC